MNDENIPLRELLNRSGVPFQLAVEKEIGRVGSNHRIDLIKREVPWAEGFIDIVARHREKNFFFAFECKRIDDIAWILLLSEEKQSRVTRARLEWFNGNASISKDHSRVFCQDFTVVEASPESDFCIVPKGTPIKSLEEVCSELLAACHDLLSNNEIRLASHSAIIVPVIVTNVMLKVCRLDPQAVPLDTGKIGDDVADFIDVPFVRFRKSLVTRRSNSYDTSRKSLRDWTSDRERTVFIVRPSALGHFFSGFRAFPDADEIPTQFTNPPKSVKA